MANREKFAAAYVRRLRWRLFLTAADARTPIKAEGWEHGVKDATADWEELQRRLRQHPRANLALACGEGSDVLALDVDCKPAVDGFASLAELEAEFGALPRTARTSTPSGGAHFLFCYPQGHAPRNRVGLKRWDQSGARRVYAGLDVRAEGASIALPPSVRGDGVYAWVIPPRESLAVVPDWLLALMLSEPPARPPAPPLRLENWDSRARYAAAAINAEAGDLARMGRGGRNQALFVSAARLGELVGAGLAGEEHVFSALEAAASECGLVADDGLHSVRASIRSGLERGMTKPREIRA